ncbi:DUF6557 family protein [Ancylomarina longa]|uniref:Uncharacterized protein n=1 Tax=Ancylomarina longa TaxID=2487017 RepID=A0A434AVE6_9BACT|nr:DUF6557 family protein [Ancylomarina longa]RUT78422.1 hypothetical protein DLK05_08870 [Ancylomarina longa]
MKLKELIEQYQWLEIRKALCCLYTETDRNLEGYELVFEKLKHITPKENNFEIVLQTIKEENWESYVHVNATDLSSESTDEFSGSWSLMGTPWNEWLFMPISKESMENFTEIEILAHCLWEMTYCGFEEESIQEFNDKLDDEEAEFESLTEDERKEKYSTFDEIKEKYNYPKDDNCSDNK